MLYRYFLFLCFLPCVLFAESVWGEDADGKVEESVLLPQNQNQQQQLELQIQMLTAEIDGLLTLEDAVRKSFIYMEQLENADSLSRGVDNSCLQRRCFNDGQLLIKITTTDDDACSGDSSCSVRLDLGGGVDIVETDTSTPTVIEFCGRLKDSDSCRCERTITKLQIEKQTNEMKTIKIKQVELYAKSSDESLQKIFAATVDSGDSLNDNYLHFSNNEIIESEDFKKSRDRLMSKLGFLALLALLLAWCR